MTLVPIGEQAEVVGTLEMVDGELVVRIRRPHVRDVTARVIPSDDGPPTTLAHLPYMRYISPAERAERRRRWESLPRWRRWFAERPL